MKIPGFGGAATNTSKVDLPPANNMGKIPGNQTGRPDLPAANNGKTSPLSFASNALGGVSTLASLAGIGGNQNRTQANGSNGATDGNNSLQGGGLMQQLMMLLGLQQLLGGGQQQTSQQPTQSHAPSSHSASQSKNPLEQLMQMLQQLLQQLMGTGKGQGTGQNQGTGHSPQSPSHGQGVTDNASQQSGGMGGMLKNVLMMLGLSSVLQMLTGGSQGQSSQNNTQL
ncbi:hypothetical protein [Vagococcus sp. WN89Y]|uniref:hypothetical protein n=1 Tax=Vagococcus sp. WN89Y TaxID=3457258 RepID=UPI003FCE0BCF